MWFKQNIEISGSWLLWGVHIYLQVMHSEFKWYGEESVRQGPKLFQKSRSYVQIVCSRSGAKKQANCSHYAENTGHHHKKCSHLDCCIPKDSLSPCTVRTKWWDVTRFVGYLTNTIPFLHHGLINVQIQVLGVIFVDMWQMGLSTEFIKVFCLFWSSTKWDKNSPMKGRSLYELYIYKVLTSQKTHYIPTYEIISTNVLRKNYLVLLWQPTETRRKVQLPLNQVALGLPLPIKRLQQR